MSESHISSPLCHVFHRFGAERSSMVMAGKVKLSLEARLYCGRRLLLWSSPHHQLVMRALTYCSNLHVALRHCRLEPLTLDTTKDFGLVQNGSANTLHHVHHSHAPSAPPSLPAFEGCQICDPSLTIFPILGNSIIPTQGLSRQGQHGHRVDRVQQIRQ